MTSEGSRGLKSLKFCIPYESSTLIYGHSDFCTINIGSPTLESNKTYVSTYLHKFGLFPFDPQISWSYFSKYTFLLCLVSPMCHDTIVLLSSRLSDEDNICLQSSEKNLYLVGYKPERPSDDLSSHLKGFGTRIRHRDQRGMAPTGDTTTIYINNHTFLPRNVWLL